jgi:signal peptide peptidase SppA
MRYPHILAAIRSAKWAVQPATLQAIRDLLSSRLTMDRADAGAVLTSIQTRSEAPRRRAEINQSAAPGAARISVVPVFGIIGKRLDEFETMCGGCDLENVEAAIARAVNDPRSEAIVLHFDSPGGVVTGVPELAAKIRAWSDEKPIYAFTDKLMASAAYWLASACTGVFCTPTADVGSIGVYMAVIDESEAWAKEGYKLVLVKAGARKAEGMTGAAISDDTISAWQSEVDEIYGMFTGDVNTARPTVESGAMQGQTFMGAAALEVELVDGVVPDINTLAAQIVAEI